MAWSDAARAAALEVRRRHAKIRQLGKDLAGSSMSKEFADAFGKAAGAKIKRASNGRVLTVVEHGAAAARSARLAKAGYTPAVMAKYGTKFRAVNNMAKVYLKRAVEIAKRRK